MNVYEVKEVETGKTHKTGADSLDEAMDNVYRQYYNKATTKPVKFGDGQYSIIKYDETIVFEVSALN